MNAQQIANLFFSNPTKCAALCTPGDVSKAMRETQGRIEDRHWAVFLAARTSFLQKKKTVSVTSPPAPPVTPASLVVESVGLEVPFSVEPVDLATPETVQDLSVTDLRKRAKEAGIKGWSVLKRDALVEALALIA